MDFNNNRITNRITKKEAIFEHIPPSVDQGLLLSPMSSFLFRQDLELLPPNKNTVMEKALDCDIVD